MSAHGGSYLTYAAVAAGIAIVATLVTNAAVDPYRIIGTPAFSGLSVVKPRAQQRRAESKRFQVARVLPRTLILGNSRAEVGFDPESVAWPASARPVYNLAIPGSGIVAARNELAGVLGTHRPERLLVGVEFLDFLIDRHAPDEAPPAKMQGPWDRARAVADALLSLDAFADSLRTVSAQRDPYAPDLTALGFNPMREYVRFAEAEGYFGLFRQRYQESRRALSRAPRAIRNERGASPDFAALEEVLAETKRRGIRVDLVAYPYHATQLLLFDELGLWKAFEEWKQALAEVVGRYSNVTVWDFAVFDEFTQQPIPGPDVRPGSSPWYWEPSHFKRELGERILRRIVECDGREGCADQLPPAGALLDAHLAGQRTMQARYRSAVQQSRVHQQLDR